MSPLPIIDLHCDLLGYLAMQEGSTAQDVDAIGCALPHLKSGGVKVQVCALFSLTQEGSYEMGLRQAEKYQELLESGAVTRWEKHLQWEDIRDDDKIYVLPAIENASNFADEDTGINQTLYQMEILMSKIGKPLYITMTHHAENRFGGGNRTKVGLKPDGAVLLEYLDKRDIAIDLSHTSDVLAHEIFKYIAGRKLEIPLIASHSNFRSVNVHARNLPDSYAEYLFKKEGIMGLNFVKDFVGNDSPDLLIEHFRHGHQMQAPMAFAADYFAPSLMPPEYQRPGGYFHDAHQNASCYPEILSQLAEFMSEAELEKVAWSNALQFMRRLGF